MAELDTWPAVCSPQNYPLTLEQQLMLCRCHHAHGCLAEAAQDLNCAELDYRQALHTLVAAEDMDEELDFVEDTRYLKGEAELIIVQVGWEDPRLKPVCLFVAFTMKNENKFQTNLFAYFKKTTQLKKSFKRRLIFLTCGY